LAPEIPFTHNLPFTKIVSTPAPRYIYNIYIQKDTGFKTHKVTGFKTHNNVNNLDLALKPDV
jgi:hypothetical protein